MQALYRKWRSQTFDEVIGQEHVTHTLVNALRLGRIGHAYLFSGPRGTGKTSTARLLAKAVNCLAADIQQRPCNECTICVAIAEGRLLDLIEIDAASNTGVDDIRDLREKVGFRPSEARIKFYIIDEAHMLSNSAFNALLKTLEEPPSHVIFVLATTEPEKIPDTITSRCQRFDFKRISIEQVAARLAFILGEEGLSAEPSALEYMARQGSGSMRDAISLLDQLTAYGGEVITLAKVREVLGAVASQTVIELIEALIAQNVAAGLDLINQVISQGVDPRQFGREIVEYLRAIMLVKLGGNISSLNYPNDVAQVMTAQAGKAEASRLILATKLFNEAVLDLKSGLLAIPHLPLELALIETLSQPAPKPQPQSAYSPQPAYSAQPVYSPPPPPMPVAVAAPPPPLPHEPYKPVTLTMEVVRPYLGQIIGEVMRKNKTMAEVLTHDAELYKVEGQEIYFVVATNWKERFEQPQPQAALNSVFSQTLRQAVSVRFVSKEVLSGALKESKGESLIDVARQLASLNS